MLKFKNKLDFIDPAFTYYHPIINYIYFIDDLSHFFSEFYIMLKTIKFVEFLSMDFYNSLRVIFFTIWKIIKLHNNHDFLKNIFSRGLYITQINHFRVTSQLILIGQALNEKKNKIYKIINNILKKIKKFVLVKEKKEE